MSEPRFSFHVAPEINNGFGPWFHGTMVPRFQATRERGMRVCERFSRLYRVAIQVRITPIDPAGIIRCVDPEKVEIRPSVRVKRGDLVRVGLAYDQDTRARTRADEGYGFVGTVLDVPPDGDALLARGDQRADLPDPSEWDLFVHNERCEVLR
jgi:hypothetical protein